MNVMKLVKALSKYGGIILAVIAAIETFKNELEKIEQTNESEN